MTPSPTEDSVQTAREAVRKAVYVYRAASKKKPLAYAEIRIAAKDLDATIDALVAAVEHRVRAEGVAQRIGYAVWDVGSPTLCEDADPSVTDGDFLKATPEAARETIQWIPQSAQGTFEVVEVRRFS